METNKILPTVDPRPKESRSMKPLAFAVLLFAAVAFCLSPHSTASLLLPQVRVESERPAELALLCQACQHRFWRLKALSYCRRVSEAPQIDGGRDDGTAPLEVLQVYTPPKAEGRFRAATPEGPAELGAAAGGGGYEECSQVLMEHTFGWSYGRPFVGE